MDHPDDAPTLRRDPAQLIRATVVRFLPPIALGLAIASLVSVGFVSVVLDLYEAGEAPTSADPRTMSLLSLGMNVVLLVVLVAAAWLSRRARVGTREQ